MSHWSCCELSGKKKWLTKPTGGPDLFPRRRALADGAAGGAAAQPRRRLLDGGAGRAVAVRGAATPPQPAHRARADGVRHAVHTRRVR